MTWICFIKYKCIINLTVFCDMAKLYLSYTIVYGMSCFPKKACLNMSADGIRLILSL
jgi:hypothetical protein